jgi:hypothetical protein
MVQKVIHPQEKIKELCIKRDKKSQRGGIEIFVYEYEHS